MKKSHLAFTMIELVFVIVVLGILAAVAIPRLAASRDDAILVKGQSQVSAIRSGISLQRSRLMMEGNVSFPTALDSAGFNVNDQRLFNFSDGNASNILEYPILSQVSRDGGWVKTATNAYSFRVNGSDNNFTYSNTNGTFNCTSGAECTELTR